MSIRPKFNRIWSSNSASTTRDPGAQKYNTGWVSEIPTYQVLNFLQNKIDVTFLANAERGIPEWGSDISYQKFGVAWDGSVNKVYISKVPSPNKNLKPSENSSQWSESSINIPRSDYDSAKKSMLNHIADVTSNPHKLTPALLNAYTKSQVDGILEQYRAAVSDHKNDKNNPHKTTANDIGAVPISGGSYLGLVKFLVGSISLDNKSVNTFTRDSDGVWITQEKGRLGVSDDGIARVGLVGNLSPIITEETFNKNKIDVEDSYAIPEPIFIMQCMWSGNVQRGRDYWESDWNLEFSKLTGWMILKNEEFDKHYLPKSFSPLSGYSESTIAFNFRFSKNESNNTTTGGLMYSIGFGDTAKLLIQISISDSGDRYMSVVSGDGGDVETDKVPMRDNIAHTAVAVRRSNSQELWIDGKLVASSESTNVNTVEGVSNGITVFGVKGIESESYLEISNFRGWGVKMTQEQISRI